MVDDDAPLVAGGGARQAEREVVRLGSRVNEEDDAVLERRGHRVEQLARERAHVHVQVARIRVEQHRLLAHRLRHHRVCVPDVCDVVASVEEDTARLVDEPRPAALDHEERVGVGKSRRRCTRSCALSAEAPRAQCQRRRQQVRHTAVASASSAPSSAEHAQAQASAGTLRPSRKAVVRPSATPTIAREVPFLYSQRPLDYNGETRTHDFYANLCHKFWHR
eukprot:scaffold8261_cov81-Phaeocystis_antarctica.AAC.1